MKERWKIYLGLAGSRAKKVALTQVRFDIIALIAIASMALGVIIGYIQITGFELFSQASSEIRRTVKSWTAAPNPETPSNQAESQPAPAAPAPAPAPPVRRAPGARPVLRPGPVVPAAELPSVAPTSRGGSVASAAAPGFLVQVGAFRIRSNAEVLVKQLSNNGFKASINEESGLYKVQIGPFPNRKAANRLSAKLKAKRFQAFVTPAPSSSP